ncbi:MAG: class II aldolase/adducin family protein [Spirochaetales bacterium]|nr:class II aldolase/adducin family protein [Spirochaetales bacterium]
MSRRTGIKHRLEHPRDLIVSMMRRVYRYGMTTTSGGNLSLLDEEGSMWLIPGGVDKGTLRRDDVVCVRRDGTVEGPHKPSSEYPFHRAIYRLRPDVRAIVHAHPPALVSFSAARIPVETRVTANAWLVCGDCPVVPYAPPGSEELGGKIAGQFAAGSAVVLLENHGTVTVGTDIFEAFMRFETLDFCARLQIEATRLGVLTVLDDREIAEVHKKAPHLGTFELSDHGTAEKELRRTMAELTHRAYDQQLVTSTEGTFSTRVDGASFLITPYGFDRKLLEPADMVLVRDGKVQSHRPPSRSVRLHQAIYRAHPDIGAAIIAHPPSIMAFAVTGVPFDSRLIPESYIMLRDIPQLPYGVPFTQHDRIVSTLSPATPNIIIRNDSLIVTGSSLLEAFDRLEVAEFTAAAVLSARALGPVFSIGDDDIRDLERSFNLPPADRDAARAD